MLPWLSEYLINLHKGFFVFSYISFRSIMALFTAMSITLAFSPFLIKKLQQLKFGQEVRQDGPESHYNKKGTPTMGGIIILLAISLSSLLWVNLTNTYVWVVLFVLLGFGLVGFIDDYWKIKYHNSKGMSAKMKYASLSIISLVCAIFLYCIGKDTPATQLVVPFFKNVMPNLGILFIILSYFVIIGTSNAVNLTDGLDGLAIVPIVMVSAALGLIAWLTSHINFAQYLYIPFIPDASELVIICASIVGAGIGFLWFNTYPAQVFMGDVGSLSLGGVIGVIAVLIRQELLLIILGGVFVFEALSVILQVGSYRLRKKRIFKMAPIHHHFELKGWPETRVIVRFWIVTFMLVLLGLLTLKLR